MRMSGNTILIPGGTSDIGLELAKPLHRNNTIIITGRDPHKLAAKSERQREVPAIVAPGTHTLELARPSKIKQAGVIPFVWPAGLVA